MSASGQTSMQRVLTTLRHTEPDRVPLFLFTSMLGARELDIPLAEYYSRAEYVVEGELRLHDRFGHDCVSGFFYAGVEAEAWGAETYFRDDGPPTTAVMPIRDPEEIAGLRPPKIEDSPMLLRALAATRMLAERVAGAAPVIGVSMSPFSLPVMQMGFDHYIEVMYERPDLFDRLMQVNEEFCVDWSNAQLAAGASAIAYFDPVSSVTITPREMYLRTGFQVAGRTIARIKGPTATLMAAGRCLPIIDDLAHTGTAIVGTSNLEDLAEIKQACRGRLTVLGNLNGIEMRKWSAADAQTAVKNAIAKAGPGGGFILADNHGQIPWQVPDEVLMAISDAVRKWGRYPLEWIDED